jgi:DNA-binding NarL/FixJ family response regulator
VQAPNLRLYCQKLAGNTAAARYPGVQETGKIRAVVPDEKLLRLTMQPTRILLCNRHPIVRNGLRLLLERESGFRVIGEAGNGREAVVLAEHSYPDIVLLDITLPQLNGIAAAREICSKNTSAGIVFVSTHVDEEYVSEALKAGARGYVVADSVQTDLNRAIQVVARGDRFLSPSIAAQLLDEYRGKRGLMPERISEHQKQLFCLLAEGFYDHEIALHLNMSVDNVRSDRQSIKAMLVHMGIPEPIRRSIGGLATQ